MGGGGACGELRAHHSAQRCDGLIMTPPRPHGCHTCPGGCASPTHPAGAGTDAQGHEPPRPPVWPGDTAGVPSEPGQVPSSQGPSLWPAGEPPPRGAPPPPAPLGWLLPRGALGTALDTAGSTRRPGPP